MSLDTRPGRREGRGEGGRAGKDGEEKEGREKEEQGRAVMERGREEGR